MRKIKWGVLGTAALLGIHHEDRPPIPAGSI